MWFDMNILKLLLQRGYLLFRHLDLLLKPLSRVSISVCWNLSVKHIYFRLGHGALSDVSVLLAV